jgi:hypothetical protein
MSQPRERAPGRHPVGTQPPYPEPHRHAPDHEDYPDPDDPDERPDEEPDSGDDIHPQPIHSPVR